uniref:Uncharacterized protein n=1 Tax=Pristionchus pacificus TaxID=54126 RepID=A0A2A6CV23_PRIPA|eukprot:PDM81893.1 hypothetical protein PRIPAC_34047 [Pristionchus pacificus]
MGGWIQMRRREMCVNVRGEVRFRAANKTYKRNADKGQVERVCDAQCKEVSIKVTSQKDLFKGRLAH